MNYENGKEGKKDERALHVLTRESDDFGRSFGFSTQLSSSLAALLTFFGPVH